MSKQRSRRISAHKTTDYSSGQKAWLGQWNYTQRYRRNLGECIKNGFKSIVTRPGMPGLYLDKPYYCYAGEHRYRKLTYRLTARVLLCIARGYIHDHIFSLQARARFALHGLVFRFKAIPDYFRNRRAMREFENFYGIK